MHWIYAHLIGDYLIQPDGIAAKKKEDSIQCFLHVILYLVPFLLCGLEVWQMALIGIQHFIIDRTWIVKHYLNLVGQSRFMEPPFYPWSYIVVDNIFHILWMALVTSGWAVRSVGLLNV